MDIRENFDNIKREISEACGKVDRSPEDIKVIGFDNSSLGQYCEPPISSMEIQREQIAKTAIEMLRQMIEEHIIPEKVMYRTKLIERKSTLG